MSISARSIPVGTKITIWEEPVLGQSAITLLSPRIASIFARWSVLEKQLNQLFTLVTDADPVARSDFDQLKGWDRRVDAIVIQATHRLEPAVSDLVKVVLRLVKSPAAKRDELAHRVWATAEGFEDELALLPPDDQHSFAESIIAVKIAGRCDIPLDNGPLYDGSTLVSASDLDALILDLKNAGERMNSLIRGHFFPPFADLTGGGFADDRQRLADDGEISARIVNVARAREQAERAARRQTG
ncbi:hypothetical protein [Sphingomonas hengshuiensis]|uniref:Uncharacterized protein n=1 Tax=Sphingomonas hengshuiensis TaxID=1609977 RepID=A0A7U5BEF4_9SPHN|nr:hypothetical protein [Sphingomonas hengshuiensis]AJP70695.1 hypothetical protein TS85_00950 [Sphingomonas hengshuiensis]